MHENLEEVASPRVARLVVEVNVRRNVRAFDKVKKVLGGHLRLNEDTVAARLDDAAVHARYEQHFVGALAQPKGYLGLIF